MDTLDKLILDFIQGFSLLRGYPPTVREICRATGIRSTSTAHARIRRLKNLGHLDAEPVRARTLRVVAPCA